MSFWTPVENPGTRPLRSRVFDIGCALVAGLASFGRFSFAQTPHPALPTLAVSVVVAVLTVLVLPWRRVWPGPVFGVMVLMAAVERARIAREMHDSVAHHLTVIVALSDGALAAVTRSPAQASEAIRGVSSTAREALAETRRLLGILRAEGGQELRQPLPGLSDLEGLFTRVRAAGLPVRYERSGPPADTPSGVQLVIFRLVQEALTNTMKHSGPGASAAVRLQLAPGEVRVEVEDDGIGSAGVPRAPGGGLTGMADRIGAFGGELTCGPRQPRGWRVAAHLDPGTAVAP